MRTNRQKRSPKVANRTTSARKKGSSHPEEWTAGVFRTRDPRNMTREERRRLRSRNRLERDIVEGRVDIDIICVPDGSVQQGVLHFPAYWFNGEAWVFVHQTWLRIDYGHFDVTELLPKRAFATLFSYLPPLPEKAFQEHRQVSRKSE
jgi:hypothetical protein